MRSKAPLAMMEQMVMILVFALAAALCLQAFVKSDALSRQSEARDRAAELCQNAAESVRSAEGETWQTAGMLGVPYPYGYTRMPLSVCYDGAWALSDAEGCVYHLSVVPIDSGVDGLGKASVSVTETSSGDTLFALEVCWQEVSVP